MGRRFRNDVIRNLIPRFTRYVKICAKKVHIFTNFPQLFTNFHSKRTHLHKFLQIFTHFHTFAKTGHFSPNTFSDKHLHAFTLQVSLDHISTSFSQFIPFFLQILLFSAQTSRKYLIAVPLNLYFLFDISQVFASAYKNKRQLAP
jgi:hypothetical protein